MYPFIDPIVFATLGFMLTWLVMTMAIRGLCKIWLGPTKNSRKALRARHYHR